MMRSQEIFFFYFLKYFVKYPKLFLQGLVDLLESYILPVVDEMMDDVESGKAWTLGQVPETITRLMQGLNEVACLVPESFYEVNLVKIE